MLFDISPAVALASDGVTFAAQAFRNRSTGQEHLALSLGLQDRPYRPVPAVRIHSECLTGDVFGSQRCDCQSQLAWARDLIVERGHGLIVYLRQEGRGIGLFEKLRAYDLQARGYDTYQANVALGHPPDARGYGEAIFILKHYGLERIDLMTNNPAKVAAVEHADIAVESQVLTRPAVNEHNAAYLSAKFRWFAEAFAPMEI